MQCMARRAATESHSCYLVTAVLHLSVVMHSKWENHAPFTLIFCHAEAKIETGSGVTYNCSIKSRLLVVDI